MYGITATINEQTAYLQLAKGKAETYWSLHRGDSHPFPSKKAASEVLENLTPADGLKYEVIDLSDAFVQAAYYFKNSAGELIQGGGNGTTNNVSNQ